MLFVAEMMYRVLIYYHVWLYIFEFFPVPYIFSCSAFRMNYIVRTPLTRITSAGPVHLLATNSTHRSARNTMLMPIDVYDPWKANTVLMDRETTLKTYVRASISLQPARITCERIKLWKKGELVIMSFQTHKISGRWVQNTTHIHAEVTRRAMIKQFLVYPSSAKTAFTSDGFNKQWT